MKVQNNVIQVQRTEAFSAKFLTENASAAAPVHQRRSTRTKKASSAAQIHQRRNATLRNKI